MSSWKTRDMGRMHLLSGSSLLAAKQIAKLDYERTHFCFLRTKNLFFAISFTYLRFSISSLILNTRLLPACPVCVLFYAFLTSNSHQYISTRLQDLCNASFSAFHSKQINTMIYNYLYVSDNYDSNPSFYEEQPPVIAGRSGFG